MAPHGCRSFARRIRWRRGLRLEYRVQGPNLCGDDARKSKSLIALEITTTEPVTVKRKPETLTVQGGWGSREKNEQAQSRPCPSAQKSHNTSSAAHQYTPTQRLHRHPLTLTLDHRVGGLSFAVAWRAGKGALQRKNVWQTLSTTPNHHGSK